MKTLKKLKLNQVSKVNLEQQEMGKLSGGIEVWPNCGCACAYATSGGSSESNNGSANHSKGLYS